MRIAAFIMSLPLSERLLFSMEALFRLALAGLFGGIVGFEREHSHRPAGFRTHILVAVGSALIMLTSSFMFNEFHGKTNIDPARLGAQVISGIGFLGAGTILREGFSVKGLTTAASLWTVSCIGLATGIGYYEGAAIATVFLIVTLHILRSAAFKGSREAVVSVSVTDYAAATRSITNLARENMGAVKSIQIVVQESDESVIHKKKEMLVLKVRLAAQNLKKLEKIKSALIELEEVLDTHEED